MKMPARVLRLAACVVLVSFGAFVCSAQAPDPSDALSFQTHSAWQPRLNIPAGQVMVYGIDASLPQRINSWKSHGYRVAVMTGVSWGEYADYINGTFDGQKHLDEAQTAADGKPVLHGTSTTIPYMVPSVAYGNFLVSGVLKALDAGAEAIYMEEPEFWAKAGWSETFRREWADYYHEPWRAPDSSPDAQYRASKLKYFLYRRALGQVFDAVHQYGLAHHRAIPCYVATHSLLNYAQWRIVSPESSLIDVGADGYIAQVWTGTARSPNFLNGKAAERTFETAFLEYGAMQNLVRASGRKVWYLNDPIEDNPNHGWDDYRRNWEATLTASLLQPEVSRYETLPWPERIFGPHSLYPETEAAAKSHDHLVPKIPIPAQYASELQGVFHALGELQSAPSRWERAGTPGVGILVSDTLMFQRAQPKLSDSNLGSFYGLALPLLTRGIPVEPVQIESATSSKLLSRYKVLLLTYEAQKPPSAAFHDSLAAWVRNGGVLIVVDDDKDSYLNVREWWNTAPNQYASPREDLFVKLSLPQGMVGRKEVGQGLVLRIAASPAALSRQADGGETLWAEIHEATKGRVNWSQSASLILRRGPYLVAAGLDGATSGTRLRGTYIDLFDGDLPIRNDVDVQPGDHRLLLDLSTLGSSKIPRVIAASSRITEEQFANEKLAFTVDGIEDTHSTIRIFSPKPLASVLLDGTPMAADQYGRDGNIAWIHLHNQAMAHHVAVVFRGETTK